MSLDLERMSEEIAGSHFLQSNNLRQTRCSFVRLRVTLIALGTRIDVSLSSLPYVRNRAKDCQRNHLLCFFITRLAQRRLCMC